MDVDPKALELVNKVLAENPYPRYVFVSQNMEVEIGRVEKHARTIALLVLRENAKAISESLYPASQKGSGT